MSAIVAFTANPGRVITSAGFVLSLPRAFSRGLVHLRWCHRRGIVRGNHPDRLLGLCFRLLRTSHANPKEEADPRRGTAIYKKVIAIGHCIPAADIVIGSKPEREAAVQVSKIRYQKANQQGAPDFEVIRRS